MERENLIVTSKDNIKIVRLNKPKKKNAIDYNMYIRMAEILKDAAIDEDISIVVLTGTGDFYCSGNDLSAKDVPTKTLFAAVVEFVKTLITFPKLLIALVNGPAVGIAVTSLALCDFVFATENFDSLSAVLNYLIISDLGRDYTYSFDTKFIRIVLTYILAKAYFWTPFSKLNIVAEGASSITFPKLLGERTALKMLMMDYKMPAKEALECGLISFLYKDEEFHEKAWNYISQISKLPMDSVLGSKKLIRRVDMEELIKATELEINEIEKLSLSRSKL